MDWDEYAAGWDQEPAVRAYAEAAFGTLEELAGATGFEIGDTDACDFGCGTGLLTERLALQCASVDAIDTSPAMLDVVRAKAERHGWDHVRVLRGLPPQPHAYDLVVCSSVCAFVDDYPKTLGQIVSRLRPGALFVQWDWELDPADAEPHGLTRTEIGAALTGSGLRSVAVRTAFEISVEGTTMRPLMGSGRMPT